MQVNEHGCEEDRNDNENRDDGHQTREGNDDHAKFEESKYEIKYKAFIIRYFTVPEINKIEFEFPVHVLVPENPFQDDQDHHLDDQVKEQ
jgi:hypothetical protein